jgi:hypothetical protein
LLIFFFNLKLWPALLIGFVNFSMKRRV